MRHASARSDMITADDSTKTISGTFETREAADIAVEHLVQEHGIARADVFVQPKGADNSSGKRPSGGDASHQDDETRLDGVNRGAIEVSAHIENSELQTALPSKRPGDETSPFSKPSERRRSLAAPKKR